MSCSGLIKYILSVKLIDFLCGGNDFETRHSDLNIESVFDKILSCIILDKIDGEGGREIVFPNISHTWRIGQLTQLIIVNPESYLVVYFVEAKTLAYHLLKLVFWKEKQIYHFAHRDTYRFHVAYDSTLTVNVDDLHRCEFHEVPPGWLDRFIIIGHLLSK